MDKSYQPTDIEQRWYDHWEKHGCFEPSAAEQTYCIMLPPPNVTGRLHMGHAFQDTIMDMLTRFHRMLGDSTLWQPGTDHAGIATQMVVERQLAAAGKDRREMGREAFIEAVWEWKKESGGTINDQMRQLGASVDWAHERFTLDAELSAAVTRVFVSLFDEGLIYRGKRLVNWDPVLRTALSDLEVLSEEENGKLWHIRYPREDGKGYVIVATTRPETMLGDTAVAVHPDDERYTDLVGEMLELPLAGRKIPVVADAYVDPEFGTGCVKITPAHDFNDYDIGQRHDLPLINIFNDDASLNDEVPEQFRGMDRFAARELVVELLRDGGLLEKIDDHRLVIPRGDRSGSVVEPYLTDQWYVKIGPLAEPAIEAVQSGQIRFVPENWSNTYFEWMNNIQDWCISRQLWWGHRIPAWYDDEQKVYVGYDEADVRSRHDLDESISLRQDEDVLDTWFSSALWPFSTLGWPEKTARLNRFYPGNVLVTGFDIIFFWVARMIMMGLKFAGGVPFAHVYIHGLIRDNRGQKMSKSKGNVLDPIDLIHGIGLEELVKKRTSGLMQPQMASGIERATREDFPDGIQAYGTDALRFTFAALATTGRDIRFDLGRIEGYRNFCNKLWNAARYVLMQTEGHAITAPAQSDLAPIDRWIYSQLAETITTVRKHFEEYRFDLASQAMYEFVWNEFCDWYLELSKPALQTGSESAQAATRHTLVNVLEQTLRLLHPVMPFITEEIWQRTREPLALSGTTIMLEPYPEAVAIDADACADIGWLKAVLLEVRRIRSEQNLPPGKLIPLQLQGGSLADRERCAALGDLLSRLGRIESITWLDDDAANENCAVALLEHLKILIPLAGLIEVDAELFRLNKVLEKELGEQSKSQVKLQNDNFVKNAPEAVVDLERTRLRDHTDRVEQLREQISQLKTLSRDQRG